ncbi:hypothetical protein QFC20_004359 [Naganishia adeliensis]|uniref:Uncharacterized protein n=1 Tax=Naganishia adeliensis TaxID=92952 RepID=A0ACC2W1X9_9TREE|nr:hypothetical protein QFC20_004359 [Naganishia adeliensis]
MTQQRRIVNAPPYIVFKLIRDAELTIETQLTDGEVLPSKGVRMSTEIDLANIASDFGYTELRYACVGAILHKGSDVGGGHYLADVLTADGWKRFDDDRVLFTRNPASGVVYRNRPVEVEQKKAKANQTDKEEEQQAQQESQEQQDPSTANKRKNKKDQPQISIERCFHPLLLVYELKKKKEVTLEEISPPVEQQVPVCLRDFNAERWSSATRLINGPSPNDPEVLAYYTQLVKAPSPGAAGFADFEQESGIDAVGLDQPIHPHSAHRFQANIYCDNRIIASWMDLLQAAVPEGTVLFVDGPFYERMSKSEVEVKKLARRFRNAGLFESGSKVEKIIFPVHSPEHWSTGMIDLKNRRCILADSLPDAGRRTLYNQEREAGRTGGVAEDELWDVLPALPKTMEEMLHFNFVPRQKDLNSCGWISMRNMEVLAAGDDYPNATNCGLSDPEQWSNAEGNCLRIDFAWKLKAGAKGTTARCAIVIKDDDEDMTSKYSPAFERTSVDGTKS